MARSNVLRAKNSTGSTINANQLVYLSGFDATNQLPLVSVASYNSSSTMPAMGVAREDILNGEIGIIKISGPIDGIDTSGASINDDVYVGSNGGFVFEEPDSDSFIVQQVGVVRRSDTEPNGSIQLFSLEVGKVLPHADTHAIGSTDEFKHAAQHISGGGDEIDHGDLKNILEDTHTQYIVVGDTTAGEIPYLETNRKLSSSSNLTWDGVSLDVTGDLSVSGEVSMASMQEYDSITRTSASNAISSEYNPLGSNNGGAVSRNTSGTNTLFSTGTGNATIVKAGAYEISGVLYLSAAATVQPTIFGVTQNGFYIWNATVLISSSVDPVERSFALIYDLAVSDVIGFSVEGDSDNITSQPGCTFNIKRIA